MTPPRPVPAIVKEGGPDELQELIKRSHVVRLSPAEDARLHALTFTQDVTLERARALARRHPDLAGLTPTDVCTALETYEPRRAAAVAAGRLVDGPDPLVAAAVDHMAAEYRATATDSYTTLDATHRAAFSAAIQAGDFAAAIKEWGAWLAEHAERNTFARRRAAALQAFGIATFADVRPAPRFVEELESAVGGETIRSMFPIVQR